MPRTVDGSAAPDQTMPQSSPTLQTHSASHSDTARIITVASCALNQTALDFEGNLQRILRSCREAKAAGARIRTGPELEITGYGCADHFLELDTFHHAWEVLAEIMQSPDARGLLCDIGMPVIHRNSRYNCRVFLYEGRILLIRPKMYMADEGNYRESRWFNCWTRAGQVEDHPLPGFLHQIQRSAPFGDAVLQFEDTNVAAEICEELFAPMSPHLALAIAGNVEIFLNGSASHHELGKLKRRFDLILGATSKVGGLYLYANQMGCDGDRLYFDGSAIISLNGHLLAQSPQFSPEHVHVVTATVDLDLIQILRGNRPSFTNQAAHASSLFPFQYAVVKVDNVRLCWQGQRHGEPAEEADRVSDSPQCVSRSSEPPQLTPTVEPQFHVPGAEVALGPALWLWDYLRKSGAGGFFLPLSGGLDSCSCALVVFSMAKVICSKLDSADVRRDLRRLLGIKAPEKEGEAEMESLPTDPRLLMNQLLFTAYLGTRYSSGLSHRRAENLARLINANHQSVVIDSVVDAAVRLFSTIPILGVHLEPRFQTQGGSRSESLALQNLQSRLRMTISYYYAQLVSAVRGGSGGWSGNGSRNGSLLVIATGNCDEGLSGYFTKYDCSSGDLSPIGSVCKNDLRKFVKHVIDSGLCAGEGSALDVSVLKEILEAIPAAELEPATASYEQTDEADMGISYAELDSFGKLRMLTRCGPYSMFIRLRAAHPTASPKDLYARVAFFFRKYAANRHKMTTLPPAYHAMATSPDDNRFDLRPFLYGQWSWQWQFRRIELDLQSLSLQ